MNSNEKIYKTIFEIITSKTVTNIETTQKLLDSEGIQYVYQFTKLLNELKNESVKYSFNSNKIRYDYMGLNGEIKIMLTKLGFLRRIMVIPDETRDDSPKQFCKILENISNNYGFYIINDKYTFSKNKEHKLAVSSVIKFLVAAMIYESINCDKLSLNQIIKIKDSDLSVLSSGISKKDIGKNISIKELLSYMLIASDNTAMDILISKFSITEMKQLMIKIIGSYSGIPKTKDLYSKAWSGEEDIMREKSRFNVVWNDGLDYFLSLEDISKVCRSLQKSEWLPWDELEGEYSVIYKGGNAPGVLASVWSNRSIKDNNAFLGYVINSQHPIPLVVEIHLNEFAKRLYLENLK